MVKFEVPHLKITMSEVNRLIRQPVLSQIIQVIPDSLIKKRTENTSQTGTIKSFRYGFI